MSRTVISYSLYGNVRKYVGGLLDNCKIINEFYPEFWIYVYLGNDFDWNVYSNHFNNIKNIKYFKTNCSGHRTKLCRFLTIDFPEVGCAFSRDTDSHINARDRYCINTFLKSPKKFQIIRDHKFHTAWPILAGLWGIKKGLLHYKMTTLINTYGNSGWTCDQEFLKTHIYPNVIQDLMVFDEISNIEGISQKIDVPLEIVYGFTDYVGRVILPINIEDPFGEKLAVDVKDIISYRK